MLEKLSFSMLKVFINYIVDIYLKAKSMVSSKGIYRGLSTTVDSKLVKRDKYKVEKVTSISFFRSKKNPKDIYELKYIIHVSGVVYFQVSSLNKDKTYTIEVNKFESIVEKIDSTNIDYSNYLKEKI